MNRSERVRSKNIYNFSRKGMNRRTLILTQTLCLNIPTRGSGSGNCADLGTVEVMSMGAEDYSIGKKN